MTALDPEPRDRADELSRLLRGMARRSVLWRDPRLQRLAAAGVKVEKYE